MSSDDQLHRAAQRLNAELEGVVVPSPPMRQRRGSVVLAATAVFTIVVVGTVLLAQGGREQPPIATADSTTTSEPTDSTSTTVPSTSTTIPGTATTSGPGPSTTTPTSVTPTTITPSTTSPTTLANQSVPVASVAASVEAEYQEIWDYYQPDKPRGLVGPVKVTCARTGEVGFGDVLTCEATPLEDRESYPNPFSIVILVTDTDGSQAHSRLHRTHTGYDAAYQTVGSGLFCRDLVGGESFFSSYFGAVAYWFLEGRPERMDADRDGIPCETVFPLGDIASFWHATPIEETTGIHFGYVTDIADFGSTVELTIDYAFFLGGLEANLAAEAAGDITPGSGVPNDYFIVNENPRLRSFHIPADFELLLLGDSDTSGIHLVPADPKLWVELSAEAERCRAADWPPDCGDLGGEGWNWFGSGSLPYWIQLDGDTVIRIEEQYLP